MPPVNYFDYFSPLADSTEIIDRLDKIAWLFVVILLLTDIILFSLLMFQSAIHKPKQFFTAPLTKYVFNYVSKLSTTVWKKLVSHIMVYHIHINNVSLSFWNLLWLNAIVLCGEILFFIINV